MFTLISKRLVYLLASLFFIVSSGATVFAQTLSEEDKNAIYDNTVFFDNESACSLGGYGDSLAVSPGRVYIIGDSIAAGAETNIKEKFNDPWSVTVNAEISRQSSAASAIIEGADRNVVSLASAVVIALGTNDEGLDITSTIEETVRSVESINNSAKIFWVNVAAGASRSDVNGVNESIHSNSSTNNYRVISWHNEVFGADVDAATNATDLVDEKGYLGADDIIPNTKGNEAYSNMLFSNISQASNIGSSGTGGDNRQRAYAYFQGVGFTAEQSAGIVGNLMSETAGTMDPSIEQGRRNEGFNPDVARGYGLAQWTSSDRKHLLQDYANATGREIDDFDMQLDFIMFEFGGSDLLEQYSRPGAQFLEGGREGAAYRDLLQQSTVEDSAVSFARKYERNSASLDEAAGKIDYDTAFSHRIGNAIAVYTGLEANGNFSSIFNDSCTSFNQEIITGDTVSVPCKGEINGEYEANGYKDGKLYKIRVCVIKLPDGKNGPHVNSQLSEPLYALFVDSWSEGVPLTGGGFRTMAGQIAARERNGCPDIYESKAGTCRVPTARPGYSNHQMGFAIDFHNIAQCPSSVTEDGKKRCIAPGNPRWEWLRDRAGEYGLQQLRTEAWHWSIDGH